MFPSVACSSYFGYFVQFSRCGLISVEIRFKHLIPKCLNPISTTFLGTHLRWDAGGPALQAFWRSQNLAAGGIHFRRGCQILSGPHFDARIKMGGGPKWARTTDLTIISRAL